MTFGYSGDFFRDCEFRRFCDLFDDGELVAVDGRAGVRLSCGLGASSGGCHFRFVKSVNYGFVCL